MNGHMNMQHYLAVHEAASSAAFDALGFGQSYIDARNRSFFDLEHHLRYLQEVMIGDELTAHVRLLDRSNKVVHHLGYILNQSTREVAKLLETISACVDLDTRRVTPFLPSEATWIDEAMRVSEALGWRTSGGGVMSAHRPT